MIILTSYGLRSPIIAEKIRVLIKPKDMKVFIIPFAGFDYNLIAKKESDALINFGFEKNNIYVCDVSNADEHKNKHIDMIYVPGGNQFKLLYECKKNKMLNWIKQSITDGCHYFGVSAGADLATSDLEYLKLVDECNYELENFVGLKLINEKVLCHIDQRDWGVLQAVKDYDGRGVLFLKNNDVYIAKTGGMEYV